jgi:hypothetical protein
MLLKGTHFPYVAAIWAYEHGHDYWADRAQTPATTLSMGGPETSPFKKRPPPNSSFSSPRALAAATGVQASLDGHHPGRSSSGFRPHTATGTSEGDAQLKSLVINLSSQVEQLTAMIGHLQGQQAAANPDAERVLGGETREEVRVDFQSA